MKLIPFLYDKTTQLLIFIFIISINVVVVVVFCSIGYFCATISINKSVYSMHAAL